MRRCSRCSPSDSAVSSPGSLTVAASAFLLGVSSPSRDLIVRASAPAESLGLAFGFTSTGLSIGFALGPIAVGGLMDLGRPDLAILVG